jgi:hypothetical protein
VKFVGIAGNFEAYATLEFRVIATIASHCCFFVFAVTYSMYILV